MTKEEILVRQIIGPCRNEIAGFICAVREMGRLLFEEGRALGEILVTRDIYPAAARMTQKNIHTATRQIERVGNLCWDSLDRNQKLKSAGRRT
ncbi:MAG: hypothetical protein LUE87_05625 [Lachnospiraceae bacterium]|nr:hypothetical protein [Lachnospiraceae bacterium]